MGLSVLAVAGPRASVPHVLWNTTPSVPVGLYWIASAAPTTGELAVIRLPDALRALAAARGYLGETAYLIKPVAAGTGDLVCRHAATLIINGQVAHSDEVGRGFRAKAATHSN